MNSIFKLWLTIMRSLMSRGCRFQRVLERQGVPPLPPLQIISRFITCGFYFRLVLWLGRVNVDSSLLISISHCIWWSQQRLAVLYQYKRRRQQTHSLQKVDRQHAILSKHHIFTNSTDPTHASVSISLHSSCFSLPNHQTRYHKTSAHPQSAPRTIHYHPQWTPPTPPHL